MTKRKTRTCTNKFFTSRSSFVGSSLFYFHLFVVICRERDSEKEEMVNESKTEAKREIIHKLHVFILSNIKKACKQTCTNSDVQK